MKSSIKKHVFNLINDQPMSLERKFEVLNQCMDFIEFVDSESSISISYNTLKLFLGNDYQYILGMLMDIENPIINQSIDRYSNNLKFRLNSKFKRPILAV